MTPATLVRTTCAKCGHPIVSVSEMAQVDAMRDHGQFRRWQTAPPVILTANTIKGGS